MADEDTTTTTTTETTTATTKKPEPTTTTTTEKPKSTTTTTTTQKPEPAEDSAPANDAVLGEDTPNDVLEAKEQAQADARQTALKNHAAEQAANSQE